MNDEHWFFIREFLRNPLRTASIIPSSPKVARQMAAALPAEGEPVVVELGPGTGAFTTAIQRRLGGRGHHLAVELNDRFAALLRARFPSVDVAVSDAVHVRKLLDDRGVTCADAVISGLPHALFSQSLQHRLMGAVQDSLAPDGMFVAYAYVHAAWSPPARRFGRLLKTVFKEVAVGKVVWANLPPAFVYTARHVRTPPRPGIADANVSKS
ncbi:rRNA adenine N-6-methyltransferase family protein [Nonomuraea sp. NPDC049421]|uniref:class I SAM-dependent methyltransferase n=1 Tax=Nonomuraea sp. NPDC049421 TaxID=3155275 RepID=UPI003417A5F0